jgi:hypothetical protein
VSSTLTGRATFILNPNALLIAENDADLDFGVSANVAVQRIAQAASATAWPSNPPSRRDWRISKELTELSQLGASDPVKCFFSELGNGNTRLNRETYGKNAENRPQLRRLG